MYDPRCGAIDDGICASRNCTVLGTRNIVKPYLVPSNRDRAADISGWRMTLDVEIAFCALVQAPAIPHSGGTSARYG
jgi:hypothetical protein